MVTLAGLWQLLKCPWFRDPTYTSNHKTQVRIATPAGQEAAAIGSARGMLDVNKCL
jgi:hypothetical protein